MDSFSVIIELLLIVMAILCGVSSAGLSAYICRVEDGTYCNVCSNRKTCFAHKKLGKDSNWISEFMLITYWKMCRNCKEIINIPLWRYFVIILYDILAMLLLFWSKGSGLDTIIYCIVSVMLIALSVVDWNTQYIPVEYTCIIFLCGLIHLFADFSNWLQYLIGLIAVSGFLCIVNWIATPIIRRKYEGGNEIDSVIGDGDVKLMAATGLLLGWKLNFVALGIGCVIGSIIQIVLVKVKGSDRQFALGPYLSLGIYITMICGEQLVSWYLNMIGISPM